MSPRPAHTVCLALLACAGSVGTAACSRGSGSDSNAALERYLAAELGRVLGAEAPSVSCSASADARAAAACTVSMRGDAPFIVDVSGALGADAGQPRWKPRGRKKFELQIAQGLAREVRQRPESVMCPEDGDVAAGFDCRATLPGGVVTDVHVIAAGEPERFVWIARNVLMPGPIEASVADELTTRGTPGRVDCGNTVRPSQPGSSFTCSIRYAGGHTGPVNIAVVDADGHVQYELDSPP